MSDNRDEAFKKAMELVDAGNLEEALNAIETFTSESGIEYSLSEIKTINVIICEKLTSCSFDDKKSACFSCLPLLEDLKITKSAEWLELYTDAVYEVFSKLSRCARDEERSNAWSRLKDIFYEISLAAKKIWKDKNAPGGLEVYVSYAKLVKSYLDVADEDSFKICENYAKEAKYVGKGVLGDEEYLDAKKSIDSINKLINNAKQEKEFLSD
uniref:DUF7758 domain-containing protein n=1 Tax=Caenorhabditis japonica TaxID=281687 RepID=A0A8R1HIE3_CAEJA